MKESMRNNISRIVMKDEVTRNKQLCICECTLLEKIVYEADYENTYFMRARLICNMKVA